MVAFYNAGDQELYKNYQYLPQERYRLGLNLPKTEQDTSSINTNFGLPATNAFTNTGNTNFNFQSGNAFGYGSPVNEVNVRTFNPQKLDGPQMPPELGISTNTFPLGENVNMSVSQYGSALPGGQVRNVYARAINSIMGGKSPDSISPDYPEYTLAEVAKLANNSIMGYKEQYGAQGQYVSPYDDTVDQSKYTTTIGSFPSRAFFNRLRNKGVNLAHSIPFIGPVARVFNAFLPERENRGPGGGTYGIGGLTDAQKAQYNALAKEGYLFSGQQGFKTLTGKNFTGKGYLEGQLDIYDKEFTKPDGTMMTEKEIEDKINEYKNDTRKQFKYKQLLEASTMYKTNQELEKKQKEEFNKPGGTGEQVADIQKRIDSQYEAQKKRDGRDFSVSGPDTSANPTGKSNQASAERGYSLHGADGGRAIFKYGGLASIL